MLRNYRNELESILDRKNFPREVKNLLLNMEYKIETSYENYAIVKRNVESKDDILKRIIKIVKECNNIEFKEVLPENERYIEKILDEDEKTDTDKQEKIIDEYKVFDLEDEDLEYKNNLIKTNRYEVNHISKMIKVYPNEIDLLEALFELEDDRIFIRDDYKYYRVSFANIINIGKIMDSIEVIRDFEAWNWNVQREYFIDYLINIIYQNLLILLGYNGLEQWRKNKKIDDNIKSLTIRLEKKYGKEKTMRFLDAAYTLSIISCTNRNKKERYRIITEKKKLEEDIKKLSNISGYIDELSDRKKQLIGRIDEIDKQLNDFDKLVENFFSINEKLSMYFKIRNISQYQRKIEKERNQSIKLIEAYNNEIVPANYVKVKTELEKNYKYVEMIDIDNIQLSKITKVLKELEEAFLDCFEVLIEKAENKRDIMELVYMYRYYLFIPCTNKKKISDIKCIVNKRNEVEEKLMNKLYAYNVLNIFTGDKNLDKKIFLFILNTQISSLEKVKISILKTDKDIMIRLYDSNTIENVLSVKLMENDNNKIDVKHKRRIKVFNK